MFPVYRGDAAQSSFRGIRSGPTGMSKKTSIFPARCSLIFLSTSLHKSVPICLIRAGIEFKIIAGGFFSEAVQSRTVFTMHRASCSERLVEGIDVIYETRQIRGRKILLEPSAEVGREGEFAVAVRASAAPAAEYSAETAVSTGGGSFKHGATALIDVAALLQHKHF